MGPEGIILVNPSITTFQQSLLGKVQNKKKKKKMKHVSVRADPPTPPGRSPKVHGPKVHKARARAFDYFECFRSLLAVLKFLEVLTMSLAVVGATIDL